MPNHDSGSDKDISPELEIALVFLAKARQDLVAVEKWLADTDISDEILGFYIQQAIEKSLKAILLSRTIDFPRVYSFYR